MLLEPNGVPEMEVEQRARALIGVRFRPMGRDPATGLDCVGVALAAAGCGAAPSYAARSGDVAGAVAQFEEAGLRRVDRAAAGDIVLVDVGARQLHVAVLTAVGHVHACARRRRVVEAPGPPAGETIAIWRV